MQLIIYIYIYVCIVPATKLYYGCITTQRFFFHTRYLMIRIPMGQVEMHWQLSLEYFASTSGCHVPTMKLFQDCILYVYIYIIYT